MSCKKYLDVTPPNVGTLDYAFRNRNEAENYLFGCYNALQSMSNVVNDPGFVMSSEIVYPSDLEAFNVNFNIIRGNSQNVSSPLLNYWQGTNGGINLFEAIRKCNIMLENIDKPIDLTANEKSRWIAEVKFLKAYYTYFLARMYGPIPLYKTNFPIDASSAEMQIRREPVDSVFNYAVQLMDESIQDLPQQILNPTDELGRITKLIALSVKAEILATAASPLFNGNPDYNGFRDKDGTALFNPTYESKKWENAATACKVAIDEANLLGKKLYSFIPNAAVANLKDSLTRLLTIQNAVTEKWDINPELIWALNPTFGYQNLSIPRMYADNAKILYQAAGSFAVPIATTELFYTANGVPIEEDKTWDYNGRFSIQNGDGLHKNYIRSGYSTIKANFNREPRYYASIGFDGGYWFGNGVLNQAAMLSVQAKGLGSLAGPLDKWTTNVTAIWPKKLVSYLSVFNGSAFSAEPFRLPRMRLSGLYLLYAECLNEASGPNSTVFEYVDKVRTRAGLKGVVESWTNFSNAPGNIASKEGVRKIIHRERRSELCFEAQAGWDLRRWKEMPEAMSKPMRGWSVQQTTAATFYQPVTQFIPAFTTRDYLWPLSDAVLLNNKKNVQNPLW
ncbi:RagB/SusD family nutrient uptake outer membrane protein [Pedobacter frigoris]|uniref:RagB/SusD family nutrient uptake outer membrane protein n=1 Tax=Pedobacter frigoris TaxID=2571272 RepID=UPI00293053A2|nr:RagB/SusD family nutrient uptake outer membrane protein [Pedobacter frigoris]